MVLRDNKDNAYAKFRRTNKEYYGIHESGLLAVSGELTQRRRQRQRKRHLKINIWEMVTIFRLLLPPHILYC